MDTTSYKNPSSGLDFRTRRDSTDLSPLEQEVLDEYAKLARNMERLSETLTLLTAPSTTTPASSSTKTTHAAAAATSITTPPPPSAAAAAAATAPRSSSSSFTPTAKPTLTIEIIDSLRVLERKIASVYTLMKASVYSIVLQQSEMDPLSGTSVTEANYDDEDDEEDEEEDG